LISGSGSNLQSFIDQVADGRLDLDIAIVVSNRPDAFGLQRAANANVASVCIEHAAYPDRESFDRAIANTLDDYGVELVILAGFMRILSPAFVAHYSGKILNIHPALLPKYPGLNTHQRVLDAGDEWHGSTVHFVTDKLDAGPRILQGRLSIVPDETADELQERVQAVEHQIYPQAAEWVGTGRVRFRNGQSWVDGRLAKEPEVRTY